MFESRSDQTKDYYIGGSCVRVQVGSNQRSNQRLLHWWIMCSSPGRIKPKTITLVNHVFESRSDQTKDYYISGSCVRVQVGSNQRLLHWWIMCSSPGRIKLKVKPKTITLVDHVFESRSDQTKGQTKDYYIGGSCVRVQVGSNQRLLHWYLLLLR